MDKGIKGVIAAKLFGKKKSMKKGKKKMVVDTDNDNG